MHTIKAGNKKDCKTNFLDVAKHLNLANTSTGMCGLKDVIANLNKHERKIDAKEFKNFQASPSLTTSRRRFDMVSRLL